MQRLGHDDDVRVGLVRRVPVLRERAPRGLRRVDPEPEEGQERLAEHHARELEKDEDDDDPERVREQVPEEHPIPARPDRVRGAHVVVLLEGDYLPPHHPRRGEPGGDRQRDHHRPEGDRPEDRERDDREREVGEAVERVEKAHHPVVEGAAGEARDRAVAYADDHDRDRRHEADLDGHPSAERRPHEQVAAELVGPERVRPARREIGLAEVEGVRRLRGDERRDVDEADQDDKADRRCDRGAVPTEAVECVPEERRARQGGAGLLSALLGGAGEGRLELGAAVGDHVRTSRVRGSRNP